MRAMALPGNVDSKDGQCDCYKTHKKAFLL